MAQIAPRVRFVVMATPMPTPRQPTDIDAVLHRAAEAERAGFDVVSVADWAVSDPFPLLTLLAQRTERVDLITRVVANATRSPLLLASAAVWIDTVSNGRFILGLGASIPNIVQGRHGFPFDRPATRMIDSLTIIRALMGDDLPGVTRNADGTVRYSGKAIQVERAAIDLPPRRTPIVIAAAGPRMLEIAGMLADGIILEMTTPGFVRWALEQVRRGAARVGRPLERFEVVSQPSILFEPTTPERQRRWEGAMNFYINHCVYPEFDRLWDVSGLGDEARAVREAALAGDRARAEQLMVETIYPHLVVTGGQPDTLAAFWQWLDSHLDAGVTMVGLPLELEETIGVPLDTVKARVAGRSTAPAAS
ncbi:MAG: LLM class flavin-dependent oxidoreductase [Chloroflexota bacterium]|nr:LLM class flavin-dependent oxidoreductase [Dehalococcoidia bacterium]MDW8255198.1 LLM class flavin-dependent oxidoreductase [Chloroflexota bacterium]